MHVSTTTRKVSPSWSCTAPTEERLTITVVGSSKEVKALKRKLFGQAYQTPPRYSTFEELDPLHLQVDTLA